LPMVYHAMCGNRNCELIHRQLKNAGCPVAGLRRCLDMGMSANS
jgi:hypothetical protein